MSSVDTPDADRAELGLSQQERLPDFEIPPPDRKK